MNETVTTNEALTAPAGEGMSAAAAAEEAHSAPKAQPAEGFDSSGAAEAGAHKGGCAELSLDAEAEAGGAVRAEPAAAEAARSSEGEMTPSGLREIADKLMDDRVRIAIEAEIGRVRGHFPEIKELGDIIRLKRYPDIKGLVERGYSLSDAVRLTYEDVYLSRRERAAAAQARAASYSTSHLRATHPKGTSTGDVSESAIQSFMQAIPGSTREQAIAAHRKYKVK